MTTVPAVVRTTEVTKALSQAGSGIMELLQRVHPTEVRPQSEVMERLITEYGAKPFDEKFELEKRGERFKPGDKVGAPFIITDQYNEDQTIDRTKIKLLIDGFDVRHSDVFVVPVTPEEYAVAQQYKGHIFSGVIEVSNEGKYSISNMFEYQAKPLAMESHDVVNPENLDAIAIGERALAEGTVVDFKITEYWPVYEKDPELRPKSAIITLMTEQGSKITVNIDPSVKFEQSSNLENIDGKVPEIGDKIRISATVITRKTERRTLPFTAGGEEERLPIRPGHEPEEKVLFAPWCRSTYLLTPNPHREQEYNKLRESIGRDISALGGELAQHTYQEARTIAGRIIKQEVAEAERHELKRLLEEFPKPERPLVAWERYATDEVNRTFGTDVDVMTENEFYLFARNAVGTAFAETGNSERNGYTNLYRLMDDINFPADKKEEIMVLAIRTRLDYFRQIEGRGETYDHTRDWSDTYMVSRSFSELACVMTPTAAQQLIDLAYEVLTSPQRATDVVKDELAYGAADSLRTLYSATKDNPSLLAVLEQNLSRLREMEHSLTLEQIKDPQTSESKVTMVHVGGVTKDSFAERVQGVQHKYSAVLGFLHEALGKIDPLIRKLGEGDFHETVERIIGERDQKSLFFKKAWDVANQKGYRFVRYNRSDVTIPAKIHRMMDGSNGAITAKEERTVYVELDALASHAFARGHSVEEWLDECLIDELVHTNSDLTFRILSPDETKNELLLMKTAGREWLPSEKMLHDVINEEILAAVVSSIVTRELKEPGYRLSEEDIRNPQSEFSRSRLLKLKLQLAPLVFNRIYTAKAQYSAEDQDMILDRLSLFLNSGEVEEHLLTKLSELELLKPATE